MLDQRSSYRSQLYGFVVKTCIQRWRSPFSTAAEILLPFLFAILLGVGYWTSPTTVTPSQVYDPSNTNISVSSWTSVGFFFCAGPEGTLHPRLAPCGTKFGPYTCLSNVADGKSLCMYDVFKSAVVGQSMAYASLKTRPIWLGSLDTYLVLSAFFTEYSAGRASTFFERSYVGSLSHYGKLVVASENADVASLFMTYCRTNSYMCKDVLYPDVFSSNESAMAYAVNNSNTVWAILYLPPDLFSGTSRKEMSIGMNYSATPKTFTAKAESLFSHKTSGGKSTDSDFMLYYASGFAPLQNLVHSFYLSNILSNNTIVGPGVYSSNASITSISTYVNAAVGHTMPMPTPASTSKSFMLSWVYYMPMVTVIAVIFPAARFTGLVVDEKAKGIREAMMIMGMRHSCLFAGWYVSSMVINALAAVLVACVLAYGCLHTTSWIIVFGVYFTFLQQNSAMCMLVGAFFSNPRLASWCAAFLSFLLIMPFYSIPTPTPDLTRLLLSLLPDVGYAQAFDIMAKHARSNTAVGFAKAAQGTLCINHIIGMMWVSTAVMMLLALYCDQVMPNAIGVSRHPLFFLAPLLRCGRQQSARRSRGGTSRWAEEPLTLAANYDKQQHEEEDDSSPTAAAARVGGGWMEHKEAVLDPADPALTVVLSRVRKVYALTSVGHFLYTLFTGLLPPGSRVAALKSVTLAMRRDEIAVLMGPNGSGKTTLMNIIAGMVRPISGHVYINGSIDAGRRCIGYCPQRNIVWNTLTVEEHLCFYARLKGSSERSVSAAVEDTMARVSLTHKRHSCAGHLSGGQLRRLCLGMALIGDSSVLLLDEPTAGMDIKGRRMVYEVMRESRVGRSVLLCTHQLDDADRVGDRVMILRQGSLRAVGSPMYLKSQMPAGYTLTCTLGADVVGAEEQQRATNALLDYIRDKAHMHQPLRRDEVQAVPAQCHLFAMQRRGREVTLRLPFAAGADLNDTFVRHLVADQAMLRLQSVELQMTSLESVYSAVMAEPLLAESTTMDKEGYEVNHERDAAAMNNLICPATSAMEATNHSHDKSLPSPMGEDSQETGKGGNNNNNNNNNSSGSSSSVCTSERAAGEAVMHKELVDHDAVAEGQLIMNQSGKAVTVEPFLTIVGGKQQAATTATILRVSWGGVFVTFARHMRALLIKRWHFAKRDSKTVIFQIVLPVLFLLLALLINLTRAPNQPSLLLDMSMYPDYRTQPSQVLVGTAASTTTTSSSVFALNDSSPASILGSDYTYQLLHYTAKSTDTGINVSTPLSAQMLEEIDSHASPRYVGLVPEASLYKLGSSYTVLHNTSYPHTLPQGIDVMYHVAQSQLVGDAVPQLVTRNTPMRMGAYETQLYGTSKPVIQGMFIIVPFVILPAHMISYVVHENECGARHLQWMSGVSVLAYWLSSFVFDAVCYLGTVVLTFVLFFLFGLREYTSSTMFAPSVVMFLVFGLASISFNYVLSFFFRSPSAAQNFVLLVNFSTGFLWPTMETFLSAGIPDVVRIVSKILRCLPATSFGESIFVISGNSMAQMLLPIDMPISMWNWLHMFGNSRDTSGVLTSLVYMLSAFAVSFMLLVLFEYVKLSHLLRFFPCTVSSERHDTTRTDNDHDTDNEEDKVSALRCGRNNSAEHVISMTMPHAGSRCMDASVTQEEQRVCACPHGGPPSDGIVMQHLTKQYLGSHTAALRNCSLGVRCGEVVALLGLNGSGKSTAMNILASKLVANTGTAFVNHTNVLTAAARQQTGYCPQNNPLLRMLTAEEHLWLYARLRGVSETAIADEVNVLLRELGLHAFRHTPACKLSGGNQRRLSLAMALVGQTSAVLLDEPTAGMDALARSQTCRMIQRLAGSKAVLLTTHLMDEVEALADRVAFLVRGRLSCVKTPQELKQGHGWAMPYVVTILFPSSVTDLREERDNGGSVVRAVQAHMTRLIQAEKATALEVTRGDNSGGEGDCVVQDVRLSSVTMMAMSPLSTMLTLVSDLYAGRVPNVPQVSNVSISQLTLDDVLSRQG